LLRVVAIDSIAYFDFATKILATIIASRGVSDSEQLQAAQSDWKRLGATGSESE